MLAVSRALIKRKLHATATVRWWPPPKNYDPQQGKDYPTDIPWRSHSERSPYQHWDDPIHRRQFGETLHEEFDMQDAFYPGSHNQWQNLWQGLKEFSLVPAYLLVFAAAAYIMRNPWWKPPPHEPREDVKQYLKTAGWDRALKNRPYEPSRLFAINSNNHLQVDPHHAPQRNTDEFGRAVQAGGHH